MYGFGFGEHISASEFAEGGDEPIRAAVVYMMIAEVARLRNKGYALHIISPQNFVVDMHRATLALVAWNDSDVIAARAGLRETLAEARAILSASMLGTKCHPMLRGSVERISREFRPSGIRVRDTPEFNKLIDWNGSPVHEEDAICDT